MSGSTARNFGGARHCVASATVDPRCWLAPQLTVIVHTVVGRIQRQCQIPVAAVYLLGYLAWSRAEPSRAGADFDVALRDLRRLVVTTRPSW
jgi:hypothetical protein